MKLVGLLGLSAALVPNAFGFCRAPSFYETPPDPPRYGNPSVPFCLIEYSYSGRHTCDDWELESYFSEVEEYTNLLARFLRDVENYQNEVDSFVSDSVRFAKCEADEVISQHE